MERVVGTATTPTATIPSPKWVEPASVSIPITIFAISALAYPLAVAPALGLSIDQRTTWILGLYLLPAVASFVMTFIYKMPLIVGWNGPAIIFLASVATTAGYSDMIGAMLVTGAVMIALGATGLSAKLSAFIPAPIVFGVVAGSILPFLINAFDFLGETPRLIGIVLVSWLVARKYLEPRVPAVLIAFAVGLLTAWLGGDTGSISASKLLPVYVFTSPTFTLSAIVTIVPVFVILISANSNLAGSVLIKNAGYDPPRRMIDIVSGAGVFGGSLFGTIPLALTTNLTAIVISEEAGEHSRRHLAVYASIIGFLIIAGAAAIAADLPNLIPMSLLLTVAALALLGVFIQMGKQMMEGPILIGPVVAFAVSLSGLTLLGFGAFFWALVFGTFVTRFLESDALKDYCLAMESTEGWCRAPAQTPSVERSR
ncbi:MAG: benzoate/H(+) symporter BenE family transporter [Thermomicrobiaceae bacterium]